MWDQKERRVNSTDHDLLTKIDVNLSLHLETMKSHILDDKIAFKKVNDKIDWQNKVIYMAIGALALFKLFIH